MSDDNFLSRWSRKKHEAKRPAVEPAAGVDSAKAGIQSPTVPPPEAPQEEVPLPPVESLTPESDFTPFMKPGVDPATRQAALRTLFRDPRFNVMDGLDTYIDDYSKPDPLPEGWLEKMTQMARLGDFRPKEQETAEGEVEPSESMQLVENAPREQPVAPEPDANSSDTDNKGEAPTK